MPLSDTLRLTGKLSSSGSLHGKLTLQLTNKLKGTLTTEMGGVDPAPPYYTDAYEVTPTQSTQTLLTSGLRMSGNVTINPIPSNYGLITWNGSVLTVS